MGFLQKLLQYKKVCIQCHNNPDGDAIASSFAVSQYLQAHGIEAQIIYGGNLRIQKSALLLMIKECNIDIRHAASLPEGTELLLYVDCQRNSGNVETFEAPCYAIIDHHLRLVEENEMYLIKPYQSCSTILWELLNEEHFPLGDQLKVALLYGLYTDTSQYGDLFAAKDTNMKLELFDNQPLFERLAKSTMSVAELLIAGDALLNHYLDFDRKFAIVEALKCDQTILGAIGDIIICVDVINLSFVYCETDDGYRISLRSSHEKVFASEAAKYVCRSLGNGGGHKSKAGGYLSKEKIMAQYGNITIFDLVNQLVCEYIDSLN